MTIAPVLPLQREDLSSILQGRIQAINLQYQGMHWKRLVVSLAAIRLSIDNIDFLDIHNTEYASHGANALNNNALCQTLRAGIVVTEQRRPGLILKVGVDENSWCMIKNGLESCEVELHSLFTVVSTD